jgi:hypothetical protein
MLLVGLQWSVGTTAAPIAVGGGDFHGFSWRRPFGRSLGGKISNTCLAWIRNAINFLALHAFTSTVSNRDSSKGTKYSGGDVLLPSSRKYGRQMVRSERPGSGTEIRKASKIKEVAAGNRSY